LDVDDFFVLFYVQRIKEACMGIKPLVYDLQEKGKKKYCAKETVVTTET
jgi:hypothetical protein